MMILSKTAWHNKNMPTMKHEFWISLPFNRIVKNVVWPN